MTESGKIVCCVFKTKCMHNIIEAFEHFYPLKSSKITVGLCICQFMSFGKLIDRGNYIFCFVLYIVHNLYI